MHTAQRNLTLVSPKLLNWDSETQDGVPGVTHVLFLGLCRTRLQQIQLFALELHGILRKHSPARGDLTSVRGGARVKRAHMCERFASAATSVGRGYWRASETVVVVGREATAEQWFLALVSVAACDHCDPAEPCPQQMMSLMRMMLLGPPSRVSRVSNRDPAAHFLRAQRPLPLQTLPRGLGKARKGVHPTVAPGIDRSHELQVFARRTMAPETLLDTGAQVAIVGELPQPDVGCVGRGRTAAQVARRR